MKTPLSVLLAPIYLVLALPADAAVLPDLPIEGKVSVTKTDKLAKFVSKNKAGFTLPAPGSGEDPTIGGATLTFFDTSAPGAGVVTFPLDASGWQGLGKPAGSKGYKYKGANDVVDPEPKGTCKSVLLKEKVIKAVCKGAAVTLKTPYADTQGVRIDLPAAAPTKSYCAEFGGDEKKNDAKVTTRKNAPAPAVCPLPESKFTGWDPGDLAFLADDALLGRNNDTPGSTTAQNYLIDQLVDMGAVGLGGGFGNAKFKQSFNLGTNIIGMLPGTDLANEYVILGAHYDHIASCASKQPGDTVCNGATDNAAGVVEVLTIGRALKHLDHRRSIVLAFWDREEDGLLGSAHYANVAPLVPLANTIAYLNFDIQGNNLLPSVKNYSFAIAAETGGASLQASVDAAVASHTLQTGRFSFIFGQGRSDYVNFVNNNVPSVFFSDATGPCYHTNQDETAIVDFAKLEEQARIALDLTVELANTLTPPGFVAPSAALATFEDAVLLNDVLNAGVADLGLFSPGQQATLLSAQSDMNAIVAAGAGAFDAGSVTTTLLSALDVLGALETIDCAGFF